jgi:guanosine-3',5'-bis(diphosphate) 3'-pyrophosphohydrolase
MKEKKCELALVFEALRYAAEKHKKQRRKGSEDTPYINHPIAVAYYLITYAEVQDPHVLAAAILHDTLEDTDATPEEIKEIFGPQVLELVQEVTDDKNLPKNIRRREQEETVNQRSHGAKLIRIADKISNVHDLFYTPPAGWDSQTQNDYLDWTERVINKIKGVNPDLESMYDEMLEMTRQKYTI